jgi:hypothetical protein
MASNSSSENLPPQNRLLFGVCWIRRVRLWLEARVRIEKHRGYKLTRSPDAFVEAVENRIVFKNITFVFSPPRLAHLAFFATLPTPHFTHYALLRFTSFHPLMKTIYNRAPVLEKVCQYFYYYEKHKGQEVCPDPDFITPELALELLCVADFLDC